MTTYPVLSCSLRDSFGGAASRRMRLQGQVPAIVYGHGESVSLTLERRHFSSIEQALAGAQIVRLSIDGVDGGLALVKKVQRDVLKRIPSHIDLQRVSLQQSLQVSVSIVLDGDAAGVLLGGVLEMTMHALNLRCAASAVPEVLRHDITNLQVGEPLLAGHLQLPEGCELLDRAEECIAVIRMKAE